MDRDGEPDRTKHGAGASTIRSLLRTMRERRRDNKRSRRIAKMLKHESATLEAGSEWLEGMTVQLAEIRALAEVGEPRQ